MTDRVRDIAEEAAVRYVRWDAATWGEIVDGPAQTLAASLIHAETPDADAAALVEGYLRLAAEGIGLGYLVPAARIGAETFLGRAWRRLLPAGLAGVAPERRAAVLAQCWNLGENLETAPVLLRRLFDGITADLTDVARLEAATTQAGEAVFATPGVTLGSAAAATLDWVWLGGVDANFLPGRARFVTPTVVCVVDRIRDGADGRAAHGLAVWLRDDGPVVLGAMAVPDDADGEVPGGPAPSGPFDWGARRGREPRLTRTFATAGNAARAVVTLETSQFLVCARPG